MDVVERLRDAAMSIAFYGDTPELLNDARAEIERLRERNEKLLRGGARFAEAAANKLATFERRLASLKEEAADTSRVDRWDDGFNAGLVEAVKIMEGTR